MRKSIFTLSILLLLASFQTGLTSVQQTMKASASPLPAAGAQVNDPPRKLVVRGAITRAEYAEAPCGDYMFAAAFEIRLKGKVKGYDHPFLYVVVPCLYQPEGTEKPLNRNIRLAVEKQNQIWQPCFSDDPSYRIDSKGLPYYCAGREETLQAIAHKPASSAPVEFAGTLAWGSRYRAQLTYDRDGVWRTRVRVRVPYHHAAIIEWTNLREFPKLDKAKAAGGQPSIIFKVLSREIVRLRDRWDVTFRCRILAVE